MTRRIIARAALAAVTLGLAGSAHAAGGHKSGEALYERFCAPCHNTGFWAAQKLGARYGEENADLRQRKDLNASFIETVVRQGMGSMPPYRKTEVLPDELDAIADYLTRKER